MRKAAVGRASGLVGWVGTAGSVALAGRVGTASVCHAAPPPGPAAIAAQVRHDGAKATVAALNRSQQWDAVMARMQDGTSAWLALAPLLAAGTDAGPSEELGISLAYALPRNAEAVLAVLDPGDGPVLGVGRVCGLPFVEETTARLAAYRRRAIRAVRRVADPRLASARAACLARLAGTP